MTEEAKIFVDSDRTIFVRNIPLNSSEDDFVNLVENVIINFYVREIASWVVVS